MVGNYYPYSFWGFYNVFCGGGWRRPLILVPYGHELPPGRHPPPTPWFRRRRGLLDRPDRPLPQLKHWVMGMRLGNCKSIRMLLCRIKLNGIEYQCAITQRFKKSYITPVDSIRHYGFRLIPPSDWIYLRSKEKLIQNREGRNELKTVRYRWRAINWCG